MAIKMKFFFFFQIIIILFFGDTQLALKCMSKEEVTELYVKRAQEMERDGKFKEAER